MKERSEYCGIICIDKPEGFTSFDVIAKMRGILKMKRLGHGGTLDPMARGVLPVFAGRAAMASDIIPDKDKEYIGGFRLGTVTDTQDITGKIISQAEYSPVPREDIEKALERFRGDIEQVPPMYSAVSVNGKRLYELARQNITIERKARPVTIYAMELTEYDPQKGEGTLRISCSAGTYIRTLINDIGEVLGTGAVMTSLLRTKACGFTLAECVTLGELEREKKSGGDLSRYIFPIEKVFRNLPEVKLLPREEKLYRNGVVLDRDRLCLGELSGRVRISGNSGFIGTADISPETGNIAVGKTFMLANGTQPEAKDGCAAALGVFDGVHLGHREVIAAAVREAKKRELSAAVFTFRTETVRSKSADGNCILTENEKEKRLRDAGAEYICVCDFDSIRDMSPEDFVKRILIRRMNAKAVICGKDFRFGKGGSGNVEMLRKICSANGITVTEVQPVQDKSGEKISSSRIRELIAAGNVREAAALMNGYPSIDGTVIRGNMLGRTWGFPTANIIYPKRLKQLPFGVYASLTEADGKTYRSISDIGIKPTVSRSGNILCETHIFDFDGDIYGKDIRVSVTEHIRSEIKFSSESELRAQIAEDILRVKSEAP